MGKSVKTGDCSANFLGVVFAIIKKKNDSFVFGEVWDLRIYFLWRCYYQATFLASTDGSILSISLLEFFLFHLVSSCFLYIARLYASVMSHDLGSESF